MEDVESQAGQTTREHPTIESSAVMAASKIAVVTGANSGIGFEAVKALLLSSKPYHIYLGSRSASKGTEALKQLHQETEKSKNTVEVLTVDLDSDESISQAFDLLKSKHGHIDVLVNNAGLLSHSGSKCCN